MLLRRPELHRSPTRRNRPAGRFLAAAVLLTATMCTGCVHRRATIRSDPPGAQVFLEGEEIGFTPASFDFTWYGTRELTIVKPGYETLTVLQKIRTPWYQVFPLEFLTDNFSPVKINNRHDFTYQLTRKRMSPTGDILNRAWDLRSQGQIGD